LGVLRTRRPWGVEAGDASRGQLTIVSAISEGGGCPAAVTRGSRPAQRETSAGAKQHGHVARPVSIEIEMLRDHLGADE
jgi:hypothetical protein